MDPYDHYFFYLFDIKTDANVSTITEFCYIVIKKIMSIAVIKFISGIRPRTTLRFNITNNVTNIS